MEKTVSAADANRKFSYLLREVTKGESYVVTSHGRPVARIVPAASIDETAVKARKALISRLKKQAVIRVGKWNREELYRNDS